MTKFNSFLWKICTHLEDDEFSPRLKQGDEMVLSLHPDCHLIIKTNLINIYYYILYYVEILFLNKKLYILLIIYKNLI